MEELEAAAASGLQPLRYVGAPLPHWHQPLLLMHAVARSQWPQPLLGEAAAAALMAFAGACVERLQSSPSGASRDGGVPPLPTWVAATFAHPAHIIFVSFCFIHQHTSA